MENNNKEIITEKTLHNKEYKMRQFSKLCKDDILFSCNKCFKILCNNTLIESILRLSNGKICFIIGEGEGEGQEKEDKNEFELMKDFKSNILIQNKININPNNCDLKAVGFTEIFCKKCKNLLGVKVQQTDDTQIFMLNKIILKFESLRFFILGNYGINSLQFFFRAETIKSMDQKSNEVEEYIQNSGTYLQKFFDMLSQQNKVSAEIEKKKIEIDKLGDVLKYLSDKKII
jgi:hypothetical protein